MLPSDLRPSREIITPVEIGIYDETDLLVKAAIWGPVGSEAVLAQLFPPEISLFHDEMDVPTARTEALNFQHVLQDRGVQVVSIRDQLAQLLPQRQLNRDTILNQMIEKAENTQTRYGRSLSGYGQIIEHLLEEDIRRYGQDRALVLNQTLSLLPTLPLGDMIYARDQSNVLLDIRIQSAMKKAIRKPEVALYEMVYKKMYGLSQPVVLPRGETFEGGDAYVHKGIVYVGVGVRTSLGGALHIFRALRPGLEQHNYRFAIVEDPDPFGRPPEEQMDFMHIDTFSGAIGEDQMVVCVEEAQRRKIRFVESGENGNITVRDTGQSFIEHLVTEGNTIIEIPREEQQNFGANFLALDKKSIIMPLNTNGALLKGLQDAGKDVQYVPLEQSTKGYGAAHCMTFQFKRKN